MTTTKDEIEKRGAAEGRVVNPETGTTVWYHATHLIRLPSILEHGLRINSEPVWQAAPEPWIYVATRPWSYQGAIVLEVDLSCVKPEDVGWPFVEFGTAEGDARWQLRVFRDIPREFVKVMGSDDHRFCRLTCPVYQTPRCLGNTKEPWKCEGKEK